VTVEEALRIALTDAGQGRVAFPRDFQGFPGTVHGGAVAALFYRATTPRPPVELRMDLARGIPTETPLRLTTGSKGAVATVGLLDGDRRLAEATLDRTVPPAVDPGPVLAAWRGEPRAGAVLSPGTATCLACGSRNPLGLQVRFLVDPRFVWREYTPRPEYRAADGTLHPALATIMLDELGWWLGALNQGECGVTTEVRVTVYRALPFAPLLVLGGGPVRRQPGVHEAPGPALPRDHGARDPGSAVSERAGAARPYPAALTPPEQISPCKTRPFSGKSCAKALGCREKHHHLHS
jgi:hypothetical protein